MTNTKFSIGVTSWGWGEAGCTGVPGVSAVLELVYFVSWEVVTQMFIT